MRVDKNTQPALGWRCVHQMVHVSWISPWFCFADSPFLVASGTPTKCQIPILLGFFTWQVPNLCLKRWHLSIDLWRGLWHQVTCNALLFCQPLWCHRSISGIQNLLIIMNHHVKNRLVAVHVHHYSQRCLVTHSIPWRRWATIRFLGMHWNHIIRTPWNFWKAHVFLLLGQMQ